jgi:hypothetical protein
MTKGGAGGGVYPASGASGGSAKPINYPMGGQQYPMMNGMLGMPGVQGAGIQGIYFMITDGKQTYEGIIAPINLPYKGNGQMMPGNTIDGKVNDYKADHRMALPPTGGAEMYDPMKDQKSQGIWARLAELMGGKYNKERAGSEAPNVNPAQGGAGSSTADRKPSIADSYALKRKEYQNKDYARAPQKAAMGASSSRLEQTVNRESLPLAV